MRAHCDWPGWYGGDEPVPGVRPIAGVVYFATGTTSLKAYSVDILLCACTYDGGETSTIFYKLPRPPTCNMAYCMDHMDRCM